MSTSRADSICILWLVGCHCRQPAAHRVGFAQVRGVLLALINRTCRLPRTTVQAIRTCARLCVNCCGTAAGRNRAIRVATTGSCARPILLTCTGLAASGLPANAFFCSMDACILAFVCGSTGRAGNASGECSECAHAPLAFQLWDIDQICCMRFLVYPRIQRRGTAL